MRWCLLLGRLLLGGLFVWAAAMHVVEARTLTAALSTHSVPYPEVAVLLSALLLALGGSSILLGVSPRVGLGLTLLWLVLTTPVMHAFWMVADPAARAAEIAIFMRNVGLIGAAWSMMAIPVPWPFSLDEWLARSDHFGGDLLGGLKAWMKTALDHLRTRSGSGARADTHHALAKPHEAAPRSALYVKHWSAASSDGGIFIERARAYFHWFVD